MANYTAHTSVMLNGKQAEDMLEKLGKKSEELGKQWKKLSDAGDTAGMNKVAKQMGSVDKAIVKLKKDTISVEKVLKNLSGATLNDLTAAQRKLNKEMKQMDRNSKEYKQAAKNASLLNDELRKAKIQSGQWQSPMKKLLGKAKGLLPAFGWGAIIAGALKAGKALFNLYKETAKARREAEKLTGLSGQPLADFTAKLQGTAQTFKQDFNTMLVGVNSFSKTMGISLDEALQKVNNGFLIGADSSGEFLDILKEYGPQFKAAGLSADQSIALISQQVKTGIYSDKGVDAIKEATLSLREMTPATRDALDAIGISSDKLRQQLSNGTISIFDTIRMVSNRLAELPPQSSKVGTAIADIFKGAGEDAGLEYITMLGTAELSLDKLKEGAGENAKAQEKLLEANTKLNEAWSELMGTGTSSFTAIKAFAIDLAANGIAKIAEGIAGVRDWFIELYNNSVAVRAYFQQMFAVWKTSITLVKTALQGLWQQLKLGGKLIKAVLTFDLSGIKEAFSDYGKTMKTIVVANAKKVATTWKDAYNATLNGRIEPIKQYVEVETVTTTTPGGTDPVIPEQSENTKNNRIQTPEEVDSLDPRIVAEENLSKTVLEQSKLKQSILDNEQQAANDRVALDLQLQEKRKAAYLSTLDTIIGVFGEESKIGKAALLAKQAYAIAETIINMAKGTGETAASVPFPANIPLIIGFVAQVATLIGTIKSATKGVKGYASGKYPVFGEDRKLYNANYISVPKTGIYNTPHLGLFSEVPGQEEMVIDGVTLRNMKLNAPGIIEAIYSVRDGRMPQYADGKYLSINEKMGNLNLLQEAHPAANFEQLQNEILTELVGRIGNSLDENTKATQSLMEWQPSVSVELLEKKIKTWTKIQRNSGMGTNDYKFGE